MYWTTRKYTDNQISFPSVLQCKLSLGISHHFTFVGICLLLFFHDQILVNAFLISTLYSVRDKDKRMS